MAFLNSPDIVIHNTTDDKKMGLNHNMVNEALYKKAGLTFAPCMTFGFCGKR